MTLTFLGTGTSQGVPMIGCGCEVCSSNDKRDRRLRAAAMVELDGKRIIIDAGPDFRHQMLREQVTTIDGVLLTHEHKDHIGGLDDVRAFNYWQQRAVNVYCTDRVAQVIRKDFDYAFASENRRYPGVPEINICQIVANKKFDVAGIEVLPIKVQHFKLPIVGFKIGALCYITDANSIGGAEIELIKGVDVLVINALRKQTHISHFSLEQALEVIKIAAPKRALLTHCSHQMGLYAKTCTELPENVEIAYDGLKINC